MSNMQIQRAFLITAATLVLQSCGTVDMAADRESDRHSLLDDSQTRLRTVGLDHPLGLARNSEGALDSLLAQNPLPEEAAIRVALLENRRLRAHFETLGIARGELVQAGLLRNPVVEAPLAFFSEGTDFEGGLLHPIIDLFRRPLKEAAASYELQAARYAATIAILDLVFDVKRAYVQLSVARSDLELQKSIYQTIGGIAELQTILHEAGNTTSEIMARSALAAAQARLHLSERESAVIEVEEELTRLLGLYGKNASIQFASVPIADPATALDVDAIENRVVKSSLPLQKGRAQAEALSQRLALEGFTGAVPEVQVGGSVKRETDGTVGIGPALEFELPIFDQGQGHVMVASARLNRMLLRNEDLAINLRSKARRLRDRLLMVSDRSQYYDAHVVPAAAKVTIRVLENYNAMQIGAMKVLEEKARELMVRRSALMMKREALNTRLTLVAMLAGLDTEMPGSMVDFGHTMDFGPASGDH
jgi:outer membrane protein TolC